MFVMHLFLKKCNPCFPFKRHIFLISPPNVAIQVAMGVPRDGAHILFGPHDQIINDQTH